MYRRVRICPQYVPNGESARGLASCCIADILTWRIMAQTPLRQQGAGEMNRHRRQTEIIE